MNYKLHSDYMSEKHGNVGELTKSHGIGSRKSY